MPLPPPTRSADRRSAAERVRAQRALRVGQLRSQVLAVALATFALAFGLVAFDGSMGTQTASSAASNRTGAAVTGSSQPATNGFDDSQQFDTAPAPEPAPAPAPVTSSQS